MRAWAGCASLSVAFLLLPGWAAAGNGTAPSPATETVEFTPGVENLEYYAEEFRQGLGENLPVPELSGQVWYGVIHRRIEGDSFRDREHYVPFAVSYENGVAREAVCDVNWNRDLRDDPPLPAFSYPPIPGATAFLVTLSWKAHYKGKTYPIEWLVRIVAQPVSSPDSTPIFQIQRVKVPVGMMTIAGVRRRAVLYDGDWDGLYTTDYGDGVLVDVDGDGHLLVNMMSTEFGPFRVPFQLGTDSFSALSVDPVGRSLRVRRTAVGKQVQLAKEGEVAPDFVLEGMDGRVVRLSSLRGKTVLLDFWTSWCSGCKAQAPELKKLYETYHARGLEILGISYDTDRAAAEKFRQEQGIPWPVEWTGRPFWENRIGRLYGVEDAGMVLVINSQGIFEGDVSDVYTLGDRLKLTLGSTGATGTASEQSTTQSLGR